jgi:hypothetical protein
MLLTPLGHNSLDSPWTAANATANTERYDNTHASLITNRNHNGGDAHVCGG